MQYKSTYFKFSVNNQIVASMRAYLPEQHAAVLDRYKRELSDTIIILRKNGVLSKDQSLIDLSSDKLSEIVNRFCLKDKKYDIVKLLDTLLSKKKNSISVNVTEHQFIEVNSILVSIGLLQSHESIKTLDKSVIKEIKLKLNEPQYSLGDADTRAINYLKRLINYKNEVEEALKRRFTVDDEQNLNNHLAEVAADGWKLHSMQPIIRTLNEHNEVSESSLMTSHSVQEGFVIIWEKADN